jgi:hypothetical protein
MRHTLVYNLYGLTSKEREIIVERATNKGLARLLALNLERAAARLPAPPPLA